MKVALVHELLTIKGGAENVLRILADMFPEAPIYTFLYDEKKLGDLFPSERIVKSILQTTNYKLLTTSLNHHHHLRQFPKATESWDFSDYDLVISSSSAFAHGIQVQGKTKHLSYIHSPARYLWDRTHDVLHRSSSGILGGFKRRYLEHTFHRLRQWDSEAAERAHALVAASKEVERRIQLYWNKPSDVIYPPIDDYWIIEQETKNQQLKTKNYFLIVSTLSPYKNIDLAIEACNIIKAPLIIAGEGPDRTRLEKIAGSTVTFKGFCSADELRNLYSNATATIFPGYEDFGLVPVESMACGTPVVAYQKGGALETVIEGETGAFFTDQTAEALSKTLINFDHKKYSPENCRLQSKKFTRSNFEQQMHARIDSLMSHAAISH